MFLVGAISQTAATVDVADKMMRFSSDLAHSCTTSSGGCFGSGSIDEYVSQNVHSKSILNRLAELQIAKDGAAQQQRSLILCPVTQADLDDVQAQADQAEAALNDVQAQAAAELDGAYAELDGAYAELALRATAANLAAADLAAETARADDAEAAVQTQSDAAAALAAQAATDLADAEDVLNDVLNDVQAQAALEAAQAATDLADAEAELATLQEQLTIALSDLADHNKLKTRYNELVCRL